MQLFLADLISPSRSVPRTAATAPRPHPVPPPVSFSQPALFDIPRTFHLCGTVQDLGRRADPHLVAWADQFTRRHAARLGWKHAVTWRARVGVTAALGLLQVPGAYLVPVDIAFMTQITQSLNHVTAILTTAGLLKGERLDSAIVWAHQQITSLPAPMAREVRTWLTTMSQGRLEPPRRRPRSADTIRSTLSWALPALNQWAAAGRTSLREITPHDVRTVRLPTGGSRRALLQGLHSLFRILKDQHMVFTDPTTGMKTGSHPATIPLPLDPGRIRDALTSTNIEQAVLCALVAFHALTVRQLQHLTLTDYTPSHPLGPRLTIGGRHVPLAAPVADRLDAYLAHRHRTWPTTANPHLFLNRATATTATAQVNHTWIASCLGPHLTARDLRTDRILYEAHTTGGDPKILTVLFGLGLNSSLRYTRTVTHPALDTVRPDGQS
ncbi:hypothetical protein [Streptomyces sp. NPDC048663]|uniref:hypothetical protein n=1 Tax=Streptomyces sp. NPDC048663 TaxID=3155638 RepID=UPI00343BE43D